MGDIRVGTASWTDPELVKSDLFYPTTAKTPEDRLRFYCSQFSIVEVDSSYYAMPSVQNATKWAERSPPDFIFNIKAFRLFTRHQTDRNVLPLVVRSELGALDKKVLYYDDIPLELRGELWRQYKAAIEPLRAAGKLGAVHFQFPKWFIADQRGSAGLAPIHSQEQLHSEDASIAGAVPHPAILGALESEVIGCK